MDSFGSFRPQELGIPWRLADFAPDAVKAAVTDDSQPLCGMCSEIGAGKPCSGCKNIRYCSVECQRNDWDIHKLVCKSYRELPPRPTGFHFLALLFPAQEPRPRFSWEIQHPGAPIGITSQYGSPGQLVAYPPFFHDRRLPHVITVEHDSNPQGNRFLPTNQSIDNVIGPSSSGFLRGDVLFVAESVIKMFSRVEAGAATPEFTDLLDIDTKSIRPIIDYLNLRATYMGPIFREQPQERYPEEEWRSILAPVIDWLQAQGRSVKDVIETQWVVQDGHSLFASMGRTE